MLYHPWSQKANIVLSGPGMGEIGKQRQLNEKTQIGVVQDLSFYEMRWILKFSFRHNLMNGVLNNN
jgi:hypothetical protein